jgi:hypothetical protein
LPQGEKSTPSNRSAGPGGMMRWTEAGSVSILNREPKTILNPDG